MLTAKYKPTILTPQVQRKDFASTCGKIQSPVQKPIEDFPKIDEIQEKITDQVAHICELRKKISNEKLKRIALEKQVNEMKDFINEYGLRNFTEKNPDCIEFLEGVKDIEAFTTQIQKLNAQVFGKSKKYYQDGNITKVADDDVITIELLSKGFIINDGQFRKYSNPLNAKLLSTLNKGQYSPELYEFGNEMKEIKLIDSTNLPDTYLASGRRIGGPENENVMESIPTSEPIGRGSGTIKLRFPSGAEQIIKVEKETTIGEIYALLSATLGFSSYYLSTAVSNDQLDLDKTVGELVLFPRGILLAKIDEF